jgi:hypothetical protein
VATCQGVPKMVAKKRTTIYIDADLHRKFNIAAVSMMPKRSMSEIVESLIRQLLDAADRSVGSTLTPKPLGRAKVN